MEKLVQEMVALLMEIPDITVEDIHYIINPLGTEQNLQKMLEYLKMNKDNQQLMRIDNLLKVRSKIIQEN